MICKQCKKEGKKSQVYPGSSFTTAMCVSPFYDEEGVFHFHDSNKTTTGYSCSNGHEWDETSIPKCPAPDCEFNKRPKK